MVSWFIVLLVYASEQYFMEFFGRQAIKKQVTGQNRKAFIIFGSVSTNIKQIIDKKPDQKHYYLT